MSYTPLYSLGNMNLCGFWFFLFVCLFFKMAFLTPILPTYVFTCKMGTWVVLT